MEALIVCVEPGAATTVNEAALEELAAVELAAALELAAAKGVVETLVEVLVDDGVEYVGGV